MVNTLLAGGNLAGPQTTANTTEYWAPCTGQASGGTEAQAEIKTRSAGTISKLFVRNGTITNGGTITFRTRKNGANGNQSVAITASGVFEDTTNTDSLSAGDTFCYQTSPSGSTNLINWWIGCLHFAATTDTVSISAVNMQSSQATASTNTFIPLTARYNSNQTTETFMKMRMRKAGTLRYFGCRVQTMRATTSNLRSRKNGANANSLVACTGGGAAGWYEDTTNTDTVTAGEDWNYVMTTGTGSDTLQLNVVKCEFISTSGDGITIGGDPAGSTQADASTGWIAFGGRGIATASEANTKLKVHDVFDFSNVGCMVSSNDVTSASTFKLRKNGADVNNTVSITGSTTGVFVDTTHTDTVADGDDVNFGIVVPSVSGNHNVITTIVFAHTHITPSTNFDRPITDTSISVSDSIARLYAANRSPSDTTTVSDAVSRGAVNSRTLSDTTTSSDALATSVGRPRTLSEIAISVADSIARRLDAFRKAGVNRSLSFDGVNDYLFVDDATSIVWNDNTFSKFSLSFWVNSTAMFDVGFRVMFRNLDSVRLNRITVFFVAGTPNKLWFDTSSSTPYVNMDASTMANNTWYHITCVFDNTLGSHKHKIYLNTVNNDLAFDDTGAVDYLAGDDNAIGTFFAANDGVKGKMKDFRWWSNKALTQTEINNVYANNASAPTPTYWLKMQEGTGNPVDSIAGKTTVLSGGAGWSGDAPDVWIYEESPVSDLMTRSVVNSRALSDTTSSSDSITAVKGFPRNIIEAAVNVSDSIVRTLAKNISLSDTVTASDSVTRLLQFFRSLNDTTNSSDSLVKSQGLTRTPSDTVPVSDQLNRVYEAMRTLSDNVVSSDSVVRAVTNVRTLSDNIGVTDAVNKVIGFFRSLSDNVSSTDQANRSVSNTRPLSDTVSSSDSVNRVIGFFRNLSDNIGITDLVIRAANMTRPLSDTTTVSDQVDTVYTPASGNFNRDLNDSVSVGDSVNRSVDNTRPLSDTTGNSDQLNRVVNSVRTLTDNVVSSDAVQRSLSLTKALVGVVTSSDAINTSVGFFRDLADATGISDVINRAANMVRTLIEVVIIDEALTATVQGAANVLNADIPILITKWISDNWTDDPISTVEHYLIPPKSKITFGTRFDLSAGSHSDMHVHVRNVSKNVTALSNDATVQENSATLNLYVEVRYIPDNPPDFSGDTAGAPSDMMWQIRSYIDELIRSDPQQLYDEFGIEVISILQERPDSNTPVDVHAQNVIENMYQIIFTLKVFYTLKVNRVV